MAAVGATAAGDGADSGSGKPIVFDLDVVIPKRTIGCDLSLKLLRFCAVSTL